METGWKREGCVKRSHSEWAPVERTGRSWRGGLELNPLSFFCPYAVLHSKWGTVGLKSSRTLRVGVF